MLTAEETDGWDDQLPEVQPYSLRQDCNLFLHEGFALGSAEARKRGLDPALWAVAGVMHPIALVGYRFANIVISKDVTMPIPDELMMQLKGRLALDGMLADERDGSYWIVSRLRRPKG